MLLTTDEKLAQMERRIAALREEKSRAVRVANAAKAAYGEAGEDTKPAAFSAAKEAREAVAAIDAEIEQSQAEQVTLLRQVGDAQAGRAGFTSLGINGWDEAARKLSLARGELRVDVPAPTLLQAAAPLPTVPTTPTVPGPVSNRWLYPALPSAPFGPGIGEMATTDFVVSFSTDPLTGVERDPDQTSPDKATLTPTIGLATIEAREFAVVLDAVPARVFDTQDALRALLSQELGRRLSDEYDSHVVGAIEAAAPPSGSTGANLVARIRNAIAEMRDIGGEPTVIALTPTDAAALDLSVQPGTGDYIFRVDVEGSGSPTWSLVVREAPSVSDPLLVDPLKIGLSYLGQGSVLVDPYGPNLKSNKVSIRAEVEARYHVRNVLQGAYVIA